MMKAFLDIRLSPDPEMPANVLMNSLFSKLHRQLVANKPLQMGMSFPAYSAERCTLGNSMRLHGDEHNLQQLMAQDWLGGLRGYLRIADVVLATGNRYLRVRRVQTRSSPARLARRYHSRHDLSTEDAMARFASAKPEYSKLPFLMVKSSSSEQNFRLFVSQTAAEVPQTGDFNCYAMSRQATLPAS